MKRSLLSVTLAFSFALSALPLAAKTTSDDSWEYLQPDREQVIASLNVVELLKRHHYNKPPLNDERSEKIYQGYLKMLDPSRSYFIASDIAEFDQWRTRFDDLLKNGDLQPGFVIYKRHLERLQSRLQFTLNMLENGVDTLDFNTDETLLIDRENAPWVKDLAELDDLWRKRVKDEVLRLKIAGKEPKAIQELLTKRYNNQLARLKQTRGEDVFQAYINAFAMSYDPHTTYLSPDNAENFDINMSLSLEGIGAVLQSDNDQVKIVRLVPAGPAAKTKQVAPADKIIGVAQGNKEMVDVVGWRLDEVVKLIRGPKGSVVRLEVIPASNAPSDQTSKVVAITRDTGVRFLSGAGGTFEVVMKATCLRINWSSRALQRCVLIRSAVASRHCCVCERTSAAASAWSSQRLLCSSRLANRRWTTSSAASGSAMNSIVTR